MLALAAVATLSWHRGEVLDGVGLWSGWLVRDASGDEQLALSPSFVDRLNARPDASWTAAVPSGMERARHADLGRIAGGRLSTKPKGPDWTRSPYTSTARLGEPEGARPKVGNFIDSLLEEEGGAVAQVDNSFDPTAWNLPKNFDSREKWPKCSGLIGGGRDQGNCGSCWAMAPAEVMSDRLCIQTDGKEVVELSPYVLMACATDFSNGCNGGESSVAYEYAKHVGIVSGAQYGDHSTCAPYPFQKCHHPCDVLPTPDCPNTCANGHDYLTSKYRVKAIVDCPPYDYKCIAQELYNNGPVSSYAGDIFEEFYAYSDGVYKDSDDPMTRGQNHGGHVIKVIGWGYDEKTKGYYWLIVNSWLNWGQQGVGKVAVGAVGIGAGVEAAVMDI